MVDTVAYASWRPPPPPNAPELTPNGTNGEHDPIEPAEPALAEHDPNDPIEPADPAGPAEPLGGLEESLIFMGEQLAFDPPLGHLPNASTIPAAAAPGPQLGTPPPPQPQPLPQQHPPRNFSRNYGYGNHPLQLETVNLCRSDFEQMRGNLQTIIMAATTMTDHVQSYLNYLDVVYRGRPYAYESGGGGGGSGGDGGDDRDARGRSRSRGAGANGAASSASGGASGPQQRSS